MTPNHLLSQVRAGKGEEQVPSIPSREAVENVAKQIPQPIGEMLRDLLAEVERSEMAYITLQSSNDALSAEVERLNELDPDRMATETVECAQIVGHALGGEGFCIGHLPDMCRDLAATVAQQAAVLKEITWLCDGRQDIDNNGGPNLAMQILTAIRGDR